MKVLVVPLNSTPEVGELLSARSQYSKHTLTTDPAQADLILFAGNFGPEPDLVLQHPYYLGHPDKCAVYSQDDKYLPLVPGVYASAQTDRHSRIGRTCSYSFVTATGQYTNPFVERDPEEKRTLLFSFQGGSTSLLRKRMFLLGFNRSDVLIENTSSYLHWSFTNSDREEKQRQYADTIARSHFVLCPRGAGSGSFRLFEVMRAGVAPVLISDSYLLPRGVDWDSFLLRIKERDVHRLPDILEPYRSSSVQRGRLARHAWLQHFAPEREFDLIVQFCAESLNHGPPSEDLFRKLQRAMVIRFKVRSSARAAARSATLAALKLLRLRPPFGIKI